ncbi:3-methyl-2-oxobutanoate hydroxymethyltransferase [Candidatus Bathyarchaeota archaeon]|nr:3-methyl-2-oxobutanoate hydroxymethyltransferase [Candidatus Bathyarchaeota archaeon]
MDKVTVSKLRKMKERGEKIAMVTAYDYPTAMLAARAGIDMILVGDSVGMVVLGYPNPVPVTVEDIIHHTKPVVRGAKRPLIVADMPFMTYHVSREQAVTNAARLIQEGGADAVKLEGGKDVAPMVKAIVEVGIPVQAHIGLMPQRASVGGSFKVQGKDAATAEAIIDDAFALDEAGAFSVVLEFMTAETAELITRKVGMPTIGIGSGPMCDGQVLVLHDLLGVYDEGPPFAHPYANLNKVISDAFTSYRDDVRSSNYPGEKHTVHMDEAEAKKLKKKRS